MQKMKKIPAVKILTALGILLLLAPPSAFAVVSATHFEDVTKYETKIDSSAPPNACPRGQVLTYTGNTFTCTALLNNPCPDGQFVSGVNADDTVQCANIYAAAQDCPDTTMMNGVNNDGTPKCGPLPTLTCDWHTTPVTWGSPTISQACPPGTFLMNSGSMCNIMNPNDHNRSYMVSSDVDTTGTTGSCGTVNWYGGVEHAGQGAVYSMCCHY
jgi:hypothetical protein